MAWCSVSAGNTTNAGTMLARQFFKVLRHACLGRNFRLFSHAGTRKLTASILKSLVPRRRLWLTAGNRAPGARVFVGVSLPAVPTRGTAADGLCNNTPEDEEA